jgi:hypothetical protein
MLAVSKERDNGDLSVSIRYVPSLPDRRLGQCFPWLVFSGQAVFELQSLQRFFKRVFKNYF